MSKPNYATALLALLAAPVASAVVILAQPTTDRNPTSPAATPAPRPATINHVVLITLKDPGDAPALIADSDRLLATIPDVTSYFCGTPLVTDRANVDSSYTVGLYVGFESREGYAAYLESDAHTRLVGDWQSRVESMRIFDVEDTTP